VAKKLIPLIPEFINFIFERLKKAGYHAYIVGGAVRDMSLKRPIADWDIATSASSQTIIELFQDISLFSLKHNTVTLVEKGRHVEVTPFRGKTNTLKEDLLLRDFTINAMAYNPVESSLIDPNEGITDLARKQIRAVGNPVDRFCEDPVRLIRAIRLATQIKFRIEKNTELTINKMAASLRQTAPERVREELTKILSCQKPSTGFNLMVRTGLLKEILPELLEGYRKAQNSYHRHTIFKHVMETVDHIETDPVLRWTALLHDIAKPRVREKISGRWTFHRHEEASAILAENILQRFKFSRKTVLNVTRLIRQHLIGYDSEWTDGAVRRLIRRTGADLIKDLLRLRRADLIAHDMDADWLDLLDELGTRIESQMQTDPGFMSIQNLAIDGHKVMECLNLPPGPKIGQILRTFQENITDDPALNTEEKLVEMLDELKSGL
jgi:poly(A) polymerase/tRNA nucleotidyltransferase (CCA-adding enzyme)